MEEGSGGEEEPGHASEYTTKWGAPAFPSGWLVGAAKTTPEKRARTVATVENRMKTMAERLDRGEERRPLVHHPQTYPPFIRRHRRGSKLVSTVSTPPENERSGRLSGHRVDQDFRSMWWSRAIWTTWKEPQDIFTDRAGHPR